MKIGYACLTTGLPNMNLKTCIQKNATPEKLEELIAHNLKTLDKMLDYNIGHNILLFRISSDIIPFGSSPVNTLNWREHFAETLAGLGHKAADHGMRLSMHPGQYTVLNSPNSDVVKRAIQDLEYHCIFLDSLGLDKSHKLILHIGGVYGDKTAAVQRFRDNYQMLNDTVKARLIIENDDKLYHIEDVLEIAESEQIPVVFDTLHHQINPPPSHLNELEWLDRCASTWHSSDGTQKIHYSQQAAGKKPGSHSETVYIQPFMNFYHTLGQRDLDIMLEVKDKNLSAMKCITAVMAKPQIKYLEREWARYKYTILEHAPSVYQEIRNLLKNKQEYPAGKFYQFIEQGLAAAVETGHAVTAAEHVWGYFKDVADDKESLKFHNSIQSFRDGKIQITRIKTHLWNMAIKYEREYLLQSYYFFL